LVGFFFHGAVENGFFAARRGFGNGDDVVHHAIVTDEGAQLILSSLAGFKKKMLKAGPHFETPIGRDDQGDFSGMMPKIQSHENGVSFGGFGFNELPLLEVRGEAAPRRNSRQSPFRCQ
jgi:hypothetical protein